MKLWAILPELVVAGSCLAYVPVAGLVRGRGRRLLPLLATASLLVAGALTARMLSWAPVSVFEGRYAVDGFAHVFKLLVEAGALLAVWLVDAHLRGRPEESQAPVAILFATLGALLLVSSVDLALIVLFLQLSSMAGYVLAVIVRPDRRAQEAAIKMFVYGAVALAVMAYGLTFLYGLTGSLELSAIGEALRGADRGWVVVALVPILAGYGFEITFVPFHVWSPDVFAGAPAPVSGFLSVVPKTAAVAALLRLLLLAFPGELVAWPGVVAGLAAATMTFGNLAALRQRRLKRLLAYSSIAQAGYVLMAVATASRTGAGVPAAAFYLATYLFMNLAAFAAAGALERAVGTDALSALRGLGRRAPFASAALALALLSLAGVPPLGGFAGKVLLLEATFEGGLGWLAVVAAVNWVVALAYYLAPLVEAYLKEAEAPTILPTDPLRTLASGVATAGTLVLGIFPGWVLGLVGLSARMLG